MEPTDLMEAYGCAGWIRGVTLSNFDFEIPEGAEEALRAKPNHAIPHYAYNFCAAIWFDGEQFVERVLRYHDEVDLVKGPSLKAVRDLVNDKWGWE